MTVNRVRVLKSLADNEVGEMAAHAKNVLEQSGMENEYSFTPKDYVSAHLQVFLC